MSMEDFEQVENVVPKTPSTSLPLGLAMMLLKIKVGVDIKIPRPQTTQELRMTLDPLANR